MIITYYDYINSGLPTSDDISQQTVEMSVKTVEHYIVKGIIGSELYKDLQVNPDNYVEFLNGSENVIGLKTAILHILHAYLLWDRFRITRYGTVDKKDEYSDHTSEYDLYNVCKQHYEIGIEFVLECLNFIGVEPVKNNQLLFGELFI